MEATMRSDGEASAPASEAQSVQEAFVDAPLDENQAGIIKSQEDASVDSAEAVEAEQSLLTDADPSRDVSVDNDDQPTAETEQTEQANAVAEALSSTDMLEHLGGDTTVEYHHAAIEQLMPPGELEDREETVSAAEDVSQHDDPHLPVDSIEARSEAVETDERDGGDTTEVENGDVEPREASSEQHDNDEHTEETHASDPTHQEDEDSGDEDVRHNEDEYDPANPTHEAAPDQSEYDPANLIDAIDNESDTKPPPTSPERKRKLSDTPTVGSVPSPVPSASSARSPKRARNGASNKPDQRGLKDSAWDRLMDFESTGEFRIAQVSRAAFTSISLLPEFAQCAIAARFTRMPMKDIRDKNGLIMRLHNEYLVENPHVRSLQPVSAYIAEAATDRGLFLFGYAPPVPRSGISSVKIPYRKDKPGTISTPSAPSASPPQLRASSTSAVKPKLDEFGREVKSTSPAKQNPTSGSTSAGETTVTATQSTAAGKPSDPRRRRTGGPDVNPVDTPSSSTTQINKSDVYNRLSPAVRSQLDNLIAARRLPEAINDNVLSRLNHLPESIAVAAIAKFAESDLGQVGNINGFLVGIINRVQDRVPPSDPRVNGPVAHSTPQNAPGTSHLQEPPQHAPSHSSSHSTGYTGTANFVSSSFDQTGTNSRDSHAHPLQTAPALGHSAQNASQPAVPEGAAAFWNPAHGAPTGQVKGPHPGAGRFSNHPTIDRAISALPVSVQNHLVSLVNGRILSSLDDLSEKCYEVLGQLSERLANDVLKRFGTADLRSVRNLSAFLVGVINKCRQEYGFN